ncbi:HipA domain-containing protein [Luteimonas sp. RD2P54]|uniref:HipA domain-containing protein n=1 Tax=Luteimonas endophytica TaxID=3042023 RepID=A0ABT6J599_9GAMM|nr:HipA domain-containing protein [Luteimonas endophytica]MDH5821979.1 HipA domain-containing protein [Luteimonas endophytica]
MSVGERAIRLEYLPEYVFGEAAEPLALALPPTMEILQAPLAPQTGPLAFLWDLVPQGRGRQHLAGLLGISDQDPARDLFLAQHGAFAPIGRLRLDTAVRFYEEHAASTPAPGFTLDDMVHRTDAFLEQLSVHGMLAAGTPGVQGVAPKFLLTQDETERWYPDVALPEARARAHWIVKLPRGRHETDFRILRHEAIYLQVAAACGLRSIDRPLHREGMLFLPRFDRRIEGGRVVRLHQETLATLAQMPGFGRSACLFDATERLARHATHPEIEISEFLCRDVLNRALRNPDNHLRNTSVQQLPDGTVQLTPLYDLGPMYLDRELIARASAWRGANNETLDDWNAILERLAIEEAIKPSVAQALVAFAETQLPRLVERLAALEADADIIEACKPAIEAQIRGLRRVDTDA